MNKSTNYILLNCNRWNHKILYLTDKLFIVGNICFNIPLTMLYSKLYEQAFIDGYFTILKNTFTLYILIFFIILLIKVIIAQYHTMKMNKILKKENK